MKLGIFTKQEKEIHVFFDDNRGQIKILVNNVSEKVSAGTKNGVWSFKLDPGSKITEALELDISIRYFLNTDLAKKAHNLLDSWGWKEAHRRYGYLTDC